MRFKSEIIRCNTPNRNGRLYTKEAIEKALASPMTKERLENACFFGGFMEDYDNNFEIDLSKISHKLISYYWEDGVLWGEFETLDTEKGQALKTLLSENQDTLPANFGMALSGYEDLKATEAGYSTVENFELSSIDFTRNKA